MKSEKLKVKENGSIKRQKRGVGRPSERIRQKTSDPGVIAAEAAIHFAFAVN
ncbi:MAG: hypothetical protein LBH29_04030 [Elusimicrobiota bacterium]|nr:hypothetical protein [Elusimicrobiota bacterium]